MTENNNGMGNGDRVSKRNNLLSYFLNFKILDIPFFRRCNSAPIHDFSFLYRTKSPGNEM